MGGKPEIPGSLIASSHETRPELLRSTRPVSNNFPQHTLIFLKFTPVKKKTLHVLPFSPAAGPFPNLTGIPTRPLKSNQNYSKSDRRRNQERGKEEFGNSLIPHQIPTAL
ncbi:hypothetical protein M0R45_025036 [Rubus argutus]|uniref:Uncharacterized protein n=1 Tax=Rubus argutus TaxID=59490 RepID=A0AAW1WX34_RUBAR